MHSFRNCLRKEWDELLAARAYWLLLLFTALLTGNSFITAVNAYSEASASTALAQGLSPLDGILVPTFGAYDLAITLLYPFVAIRMIAAEKDSGALKLILQLPPSLPTVLAAKFAALLAGWIVAWIPACIAVVSWRVYGGSLYPPELLTLLLGHWLQMCVATSVAFAAAAVTQTASTAAIVTLAFTVGTWALDFVAAGRGGLLQTLAQYTPAAALHVFERGEASQLILFQLLASGVGFVFAIFFLDPRRPVKVLIWLIPIGIGMFAASHQHRTWDTSENRRNSFPPNAEAALSRIRQPLKITVHLAPEDPRLTDWNRSIAAKLRRLLPQVDIDYTADSTTGLFQSPGQHYGEIWYALGPRRIMSRSTTEPIVLQALYTLAQIPPPNDETNPTYPGHPLQTYPRHAALIFYFLYPSALALAYYRIRH